MPIQGLWMPVQVRSLEFVKNEAILACPSGRGRKQGRYNFLPHLTLTCGLRRAPGIG